MWARRASFSSRRFSSRRPVPMVLRAPCRSLNYSHRASSEEADMESKIDLRAVLEQAVERGASDIHFKVGQPPVIRFDGDLEPLGGWEPLGSFDLQAIVEEIGVLSPSRMRAFEATGELDTAYQLPGLPRFRVNAFRQRGD